MTSMMFEVLCHCVLLIFLTGRATMLVKASANEPECGEETSCEQFAQLMSAVNKMQNQLDKQAKDLDELKTDVNRTLSSTATISAQLGQHSTDLLTHDGRLKTHDALQGNEHQLVQSIYGAELGPRDCSDIRERGYNVSGVYRVYPGSDNKRMEMVVYCDFKSAGLSWLVFQRRRDGSVNFERLWKDYAIGFGDLNGEFWLGNEKLSLLTMNRKYKLRIELEDFEREKRYAEYSTFSVKPATDKHRLTVGGYTGNAEDGMINHNGMQFTTKDADNDAWPGNCAESFHGAWWHKACYTSNLNGLYLGGSHTSHGEGIEWYFWHGGYYSLKTTEMKIAAII